MPVPNFINDGNWNIRTPMSVEYEFPFSEVGDDTTFKALATYRLDKTAFRPLASMSIVRFDLGNAYLTKNGNPRDIGCGLYEFTDVFSAVPAARTEYGTYTYTYQAWRAVTADNLDPTKYFYDVTQDLEETTFTVPAAFQFEYFLNTPPNPLLKSRMFMQFGKLLSVNGAPINGNLVVADDSTVSIYGGKIYERKTPYVRIITQPV